MAVPDLLFMFAFALVFYVLGATFLEGFVNYRTWHLIGAVEFRGYHQELGRRVIRFVVLPIVLTLILTVLLVWWRPAAVPQWSLYVSLGLNLFAIVVSIAFQIPIQLEFDRTGLSLPLLQRLNSIEWLRRIAHIVNAIVFLWMMSRVLDNVATDGVK
jgi:hypothetical protein